jgi:hypothetical protein
MRSVRPNDNIGPMTRSLPLARPSRACGFATFLSPLPKRLKSHPMGEGEVVPAFGFSGRYFIGHGFLN